MRLDTFLATAPALYTSRQCFELVSGPGVGKSETVRQAAAVMSRLLKVPFGLVTRIVSGLDAGDAKGFVFPVRTPDDRLTSRLSRSPLFPETFNCHVFVDGEYVPNYFAEGGKMPSHGILFLDEFGQGDPEVQKTLAELALSGQIWEHKLDVDWVVWMASNRLSDRSGVVKRLAFVDNRICLLSIDADYEAWEKWALRNRVHGLTISYAKRNQSIVFKDAVPANGGKFCTPRSLVKISSLLESMRPADMPSVQLPVDGVALELITGWLGEGEAITYHEHIKLGAQLPDPEEIFRDPKNAPVPERVDARFVLAINLSIALVRLAGDGQVDPKKSAACIQYIQRIDQEMQVIFVRSVMSDPVKGAAIMSAPGFAEWNAKNRDLILAAHQVA